jgi:hypothetical protein
MPKPVFFFFECSYKNFWWYAARVEEVDSTASPPLLKVSLRGAPSPQMRRRRCPAAAPPL